MKNQTSPETPVSEIDITEFHTRKIANEGIDLPLNKPDGTPTPHSIRVRSVDSDAFHLTQSAQARRWLELKEKPEGDALYKWNQESRLNQLACLVTQWTFPQPCTPENVKAFLHEAPQIADQIDRLAVDRTRFFKAGSTTFTPLPAPKSN